MQTSVSVKQTIRSARVLRELAEQIRVIEAEGSPRGFRDSDCSEGCSRLWRAVRTGWEAADQAMGGEGLARGAVHEWFGLVETSKDKEQSQLRWHAHFRWMPPLCILAHLARRCLILDTEGGNGKWSAWIGKRVWPYPHVLTLEGGGLSLTPPPSQGQRSQKERSRGLHDRRSHLLNRCIFVDPPDDAARLWAIDLALRSNAVCVVIADGSGVDMAATRRLQLAAESAGTIGLLARPPAEQFELSAAATRWRVGVEPSRNQHPRWRVELVRWKGRRSNGATERRNDERTENNSVLSIARHAPPTPRSWASVPPDGLPVCLLELSSETGVLRDVTGESDLQTS